VGLLAGAGSALAETKTFNFTGSEQEFKVPAGVTSVEAVAVGSQGESAEEAGGVGAIVTGKLPVTPGQVLYVEVAGTPFNGGGGEVRNGGGASDVRTVSTASEPTPGASLESRLLVAAGGGGAGAGDCGTGGGGAGGNAGERGHDGFGCAALGSGGGAGTSTKGGAGGSTTPIGEEFGFHAGGEGVLGSGGSSGGGGGGGGGLYGGGGGGEGFAPGGGGGGSNLVPAGGEAKLAKAGEATSVTFTYTVPVPTNKEQCKKGGWQEFAKPNGTPFASQGECVSFVASGGRSLAG
jgi:hypothetical protein